jgi:ribulose-phosphate 3-epimerase
MATIYPSLMGIESPKLEEVIKQLDLYVQGYHIDVMDNQFVPNAMLDAQAVNTIAQSTNNPLWVHLMVVNPEDFVSKLELLERSILSFHYEAAGSNVTLIQKIKDKGWRASIAINPSSPVEKIFPLLPLIDQVLIMSVDPGFSGQPFIADVLSKLEPLIGYRASNNLSFRIGMDGGIKLNNIQELVQKGVQDLAVSSAIFDYPNRVEALKILQAKIAL